MPVTNVKGTLLLMSPCNTVAVNALYCVVML